MDVVPKSRRAGGGGDDEILINPLREIIKSWSLMSMSLFLVSAQFSFEIRYSV